MDWYNWHCNGKSITFNPPWYGGRPGTLAYGALGTCCNCITINNALNAYTFDISCDTPNASLCELFKVVENDCGKME